MVAAVRELNFQCERTLSTSEEPRAPPLQLMSDQITQAVKIFQAGTARGPSGLRGQHLKDLTSGWNMAPQIAANVIKTITNVVNLFVSGKAAPSAAEFYADANLFAAYRKDVGIRLIAVGDIMRCLVSKCFTYSLSDKGLFINHVMGGGGKGGYGK